MPKLLDVHDTLDVLPELPLDDRPLDDRPDSKQEVARATGTDDFVPSRKFVHTDEINGQNMSTIGNSERLGNDDDDEEGTAATTEKPKEKRPLSTKDNDRGTSGRLDAN